MRQKFTLAIARVLSSSFALSFLSISLMAGGLCPVFAGQAAPQQNAPAIPADQDTITLSRSSDVRGKESDITVMWKDCSTTRSFVGAGAAPAANLKSDGRGVTVSVTESPTKCVMVAHVSIDADAPTGPVFFRVVQNGVSTGMAPFEILAAAPGAIPPGLEPQVDVMWKVLPHNFVDDNFGHRVAHYFYCVDLAIGNNSGYDLQIASVGFQLANSGVTNTIPANGYLMTRGTLLWGQQITPKNLIVNIMKGVGPVLTGITPFFKHPSHQADYSSIVGVITNPIEKGIELAMPDPTVGQLNRLDDATLRDNLTVPNNTQLRTVVFVSKADTLKNFWNALKKDEQTDPFVAMKNLGQLVMIGDRIQHINRIHITSTPVVGVPSATSVKPDTVTIGVEQDLVISGSLLQSAKVTGPTGFTISKVKVDDKGTSISLTVKAESPVPPGVSVLTITTPGGSTTVNLNVVPAKPAVTLTPTGLKVFALPANASQTVTLTNTGTAPLTFTGITVTGPNAANFTLAPAADNNCPTAPATLQANASCKITVTFASAAAGNFSAVLNIADDASDSPQHVPLTGTH